MIVTCIYNVLHKYLNLVQKQHLHFFLKQNQVKELYLSLKIFKY